MILRKQTVHRFIGKFIHWRERSVKLTGRDDAPHFGPDYKATKVYGEVKWDGRVLPCYSFEVQGVIEADQWTVC